MHEKGEVKRQVYIGELNLKQFRMKAWRGENETTGLHWWMSQIIDNIRKETIVAKVRDIVQ